MRFTLKAKLLLPILGIVTVSLFISLYFVVSIAERAITDNAEQNLRTAAYTVHKAVEEQVGRAMADIRITATMPLLHDVLGKINQPEDPEFLAAVQKSNALLKSIADIYGYYESYYMTNDKGLVTTSFVPAIVNKLDISNRDWFHAAMRNGIDVVSAPFISRLTGDVLIAVITRLEENGNYGGMVGALRLQMMLQNVLAQTRTDTTETVVIDERGTILAKHERSQIKADIFANRPWLDEMKKSGQGFLLASTEPGDLYIGYSHVPDTNMYALALVPSDVLLAPAQRINMVGLGILAVALVLCCLVIVASVTPVVRTLRGLGFYAQAVGHGDFKQRLEVERNDELGGIASDLRLMAGNLQSMIADSEAKASEAQEQTERARNATREAEAARAQAEKARREGILHAADQLSGIIEEEVLLIDTLKAAIDQAARGAALQQKTADTTSRSILTLNDAVGEVLGHADSASSVAKKTIENASSGAGIVTQVADSISRVNVQVQGLRESTMQLDASVGAITRMLGTITDIADQTNLLALNAAIEAARAGDAGRGFAVVADEVRKLADNTMHATHEISGIVKTIQSQTLKNTEDMNHAASSVDESVRLATGAGVALQEIVTFAGSSSTMVEQIANASRQQSGMSAAMETGSTEIREVAAQNTRLMHEAGSALESLDMVAQRIRKLIMEMQH